MATNERIIAPGVFTRENDQSFLAQGVEQLGAVVVGPTEKGPAFIPTRIVGTLNDYKAKFGQNSNDTYVPFTVKSYLDFASTVTVVRVLGNGGWLFNDTRKLAALVSVPGNRILAVFHPSKNSSPNSVGLEKSTISYGVASSGSITGSFILNFSGSGFSVAKSYTASLVRSSQNFIQKTVGTSPDNSRSGSSYIATAYPHILFKDVANETALTGSNLLLVTSSGEVAFTQSISGVSYKEGYTAAETAWITDGNLTTPQKLFKLVTIGHGTSTNTDVYASITGLQEPDDIDGIPQYSTFTVLIRKVGDTDKQPSIIEQFNNLNLNPDSPNFIARVIGDRYFEYDANIQKVISRGNYNNQSGYVRVVMSDAFDADLTVSALSINASPRGFEKLYQTIIGFSGYALPTASYKREQTIDGFYNSRAFLGFDFRTLDNYNYLLPVPSNNGNQTFATQSDFTVNSLSGHPSASWVGSLSASVDAGGTGGPTSAQLQFSVAFQGGSDGINPATVRNVGGNITAANVFGYDLSNSAAAGAVGYNKAINILSNQDEYDFNLLVTPGVIHELHPSVTSNAIEMCELRGDSMYIMDPAGLSSTIGNAISQVASIDSNYTAVYYPWVKILDTNTNKPVFVPPSVVMPGVFANNDRVSAEWFTPAGMNRGGLPGVIETRNKVSSTERGTLYEGKINPIAQFPGQGVVAWGGKTLQSRPSALDHINVRRLLITAKKFIASTARYLVFENNTSATRNKFLSLVNPYLTSIQQRQGLYAFRVVMDDSNNTPDVIDRNQLVGAIYLQPAKSADFILLDFNLTATGASFS